MLRWNTISLSVGMKYKLIMVDAIAFYFSTSVRIWRVSFYSSISVSFFNSSGQNLGLEIPECVLNLTRKFQVDLEIPECVTDSFRIYWELVHTSYFIGFLIPKSNLERIL